MWYSKDNQAVKPMIVSQREGEPFRVMVSE